MQNTTVKRTAAAADRVHHRWSLRSRLGALPPLRLPPQLLQLPLRQRMAPPGGWAGTVAITTGATTATAGGGGNRVVMATRARVSRSLRAPRMTSCPMCRAPVSQRR
jgi:hypothetical protein